MLKADGGSILGESLPTLKSAPRSARQLHKLAQAFMRSEFSGPWEQPGMA